MSYSHTLNLVQGDTNPQVVLTLRDRQAAAPGKTLDPENSETWAVFDLTGATVRMYFREVGSTTVKDTLIGTVVGASSGRVAFIFNEATLSDAGVFEAEIEVTDSSDRVQTVFELVRFRVREQF